MKTGKDAYQPEEGWQERRNGGDPFEGTQPWTQVSNQAGWQGGANSRSRTIPPAFHGGNKYQSPKPPSFQAQPAPYQTPQASPYQPAQPSPYASPAANPYQAPQTTNPYQTPQAANPYQAPQIANSYQAPQTTNPYQTPQTANPYQAPQAANPYQVPQQAPYQSPQTNPYQAPPAQQEQAAAPGSETPPEAPKEPAASEAADQSSQKSPAITPPSGPRATPPTGIRPKPVRKAVYIALTAFVLIAAAAAVFMILGNRPQDYAYVQAGTLSTVYRGDALIVRNETIYTQEGVSRIDYIAEEGQAVQRAQNVCLVYSSGFSDRELTTLENYRRQIKEYHKTLVSTSATKDVQLDRLEGEVHATAAEIQSMVQEGRGSLVSEEIALTEAMQARQIYLKQKYPDDQKLSRLYEDEEGQLQRISSWTKQYAAAAAGLVSFYTDGYENVLNLNNYANYTPSEVRAMYGGQFPTENGYTRNTVPIYRLVRQGSWVVLMLCENRDWVPVEGRVYRMLLEGLESTVVNATVETFSKSGGELLLRLRITGDIKFENILYMRTCSVMIGESVDSLMVPHRALYTRQGRIGVVIATESGEFWTSVEVVSDDGTTAHIVPGNPGILYEGVPVLLF
ncbi:MAG: hypothetical protein IJ174_00145 [Clostridia bacterium]|nr:hypothetical protein [Clostridia bacterium]